MSSLHIQPPLSYNRGGASPTNLLTPLSARPIYASPDSTASRQSPDTKLEPDDDGGSIAATEEPAKKKQRRNKPTLSCQECVERKTKVSLTRYQSAIDKLGVHCALSTSCT
jgi:hypothetical protein